MAARVEAEVSRRVAQAVGTEAIAMLASRRSSRWDFMRARMANACGAVTLLAVDRIIVCVPSAGMQACWMCS